MTTSTVFAGFALLAIASCAIAGPTQKPAALQITNTHLVATCIDGKPVAGRQRRWNVTAPVVLTVTMQNDPRPGVTNAAPGFAALTFTPEDGHRYEVEVNAPVMANSQRVWPRGEWTPVVRDRTSDRVVTGEPEWLESGCLP